MDLVIHDLTKEEFEKIANRYQDRKIIGKDEPIKNCVGCFGCWIKTPGQCVIPDAYQQMGEWIAHAEKVTIISKCTFGCYSAFVKNVLDRSISYILPYFEIRKGEMHHKARYQNKFELQVIFYGDDVTEQERKTATELVQANVLNLMCHFKETIFTTKENLQEVV